MANLQVTICVRIKEGEKRRWVVANGKTDPAGPLYLRWYAGSSAKYEKAGDSFHEAEIAQLRLERKLKAQSQGFTVPEEAPVPTSRRCDIVLAAYLVSRAKWNEPRTGPNRGCGRRSSTCSR